MFAKTVSIALLCSISFIAGCNTAEPVVDELAVETADLKLAAEYFEIRRDYRKCVSPLCGGYWVSRPNKAKTTCANGKDAKECYVAELDDSFIGFSDEDISKYRAGIEAGVIVVRGYLGKKSFKNFGKLGTLQVSEVWHAGTDNTPDGVWVKVTDNNIVCITAPCVSLNEDKLNAAQSTSISDLDFEPSGASDDQRNTALEALYGEANDGILVVGHRYHATYEYGTAKGRTVTQFYTRHLPSKPDLGACYVGGCSGQVCSDQEGVITTCEFRPEYACYQTATCERQAGGECGWTETPELDACLAGSI